MFSIKRLVIVLSVVCGVVCAFGPTKGEDVREEEHGCNPHIYAENSQERLDIKNLLDSAIAQVWHSLSNPKNDLGGYYGSAACNGNLPRDDCSDCLYRAKDLLYDDCGYADGARVKLVDCRLRFERYPFPLDW